MAVTVKPGPRFLQAVRVPVGSGLRRVAAISASLVGTQAITNVLGLVYWAVAARQTNVASVGVAGAAVALTMLLGSFGVLGLGTLLMAEIPRAGRGERRVLIRTSLATAAVASGGLAVLVAGGLGLAGHSSLHTLATPFNLVDFAVGTALTGLTMVLDQAVLVVGRSRVQLERNTLASVVKIVALLGLTYAGRHTGMDIFLAWTIGNLVSLLLVAARTRSPQAARGRPVFSRRHAGAPSRQTPLVDFRIIRRMAKLAASHHALNLMLQAPIQLLSVVVAVLLSAEANGFFSTARSVAGFVFVLPFTVTIALFAASAGQESELIERMKFTIPFGFAASVAADVVLWPLGSTVLNIFGHSYSVDALTTLRILVLAGLPFVVKDHFVALRRVQGRTASAAVIASAGAVFELGAAVVGGKVAGTTGLCAYWVAALVVEAVVLAVPLTRAARSRAKVEDVVRSPTEMRLLASAAQPQVVAE